MKKLISIFVALIAVGIATAEVDVKVKCDGGWFNSDICRDNELEQEFDTVTSYINQNENTWKEDKVGSSMGARGLSYYLVGQNDLFETFDTVLDYLHTIFSTSDELELANLRIDSLEVRIEQPNLKGYLFDIAVAQKTAARTGEVVVTEEGYTCKPLAQSCYRVD